MRRVRGRREGVGEARSGGTSGVRGHVESAAQWLHVPPPRRCCPCPASIRSREKDGTAACMIGAGRPAVSWVGGTARAGRSMDHHASFLRRPARGADDGWIGGSRLCPCSGYVRSDRTFVVDAARAQPSCSKPNHEGGMPACM